MCQNLITSWEHLQKLTADFAVQYRAVKDAGDLTKVKELKKNLESARSALLEQLTLFVVSDAPNPYHSALIDAGLESHEVPKQKEMIVDIRQEIQRQCTIYNEVKGATGCSLLEEWVNNIQDNKALIYAEVAKDRIKIEKRIKEGMIPIVMPSRAVQERTRHTALTFLQPIWIQDGTKKAVQNGYTNAMYEGQVMSRFGFFKNIPDRPYLVWTKPTQKPELHTCNMSFIEQQAHYTRLVSNYPDLYDKTDIIPTEYSALQAIFTINVRQRFQELQGHMNEPNEITPLDQHGFTRFLSMGLLSNTFVPFSCFNDAERQIVHSGGIYGISHNRGFRPAARS